MTRSSGIGLVAALWLATGSATPLAAQTDLLLFKDGRVLVRRAIPVRIPAGRSVQRFSLEEHDAGSLSALDAGVELKEALYPYSIDLMSLLRRAVGRRLVFRPIGGGDTVSALVAGIDPPRFQFSGGVSLTPPGEPLFPAELIGPGRTVEATFESQRPVDLLHVGYVTNGATWSAQYTLVLRTGTAAIGGSASLRSASLTADSAQVTLLDGVVNRATAFNRQELQPNQFNQGFRLEEVVVTGLAAGYEREPTVSAVGGVHLYDLPGRHQLTPGVTAVVQLFRPVSAPIERVLSIPGVLPASGNPMAGAGRQAPQVELHYRVRRSRGTPFGDLPLPGGVARLYTEASDGKRLLIGEAALNHSSAGSDLDLLAGFSLDLVAQREDGETSMAQDSVQRADGGINIRNVAILRTYKVSFTNRSDSTETIDVVERRSGNWTVITSSVPPDRPTPDAMRFRVTVPARGEAVLTYRLRIPTN